MTALQQALKQAQDRHAARNPKSKAASVEAEQHLPGGSTRSSIFMHPFSIYIARGEGCYIWDLDGHRYIDFLSDFTSGIYGKTNPIIKQAILKTLDNGLQFGGHGEGEAALASQIRKRLPVMELLRFCNSGTEANMLAISTACHVTQRSKVVVFEGAYHGSLLAHFDMPGNEPAPGGVSYLQVPYNYVVCPYNDIERSTAIIKAHGTSLAAILIETMLGAGGGIPGEKTFLQRLRDLATEFSAILIFDEVQTSRLAYGGRQSQLGIKPDMTTIGKFFGGGFAFGCFGGRKDIMERFDARKPDGISHPGTHQNNALTMAAGSAALEQVLTPEATERLNALGDYLRDRLNTSFKQTGAPFEVTGLGSINNLHAVYKNKESKLAASALICFELLEQGFWMAQRGLICLNLENRKEDVDALVEAVLGIVEKYKAAFKAAAAED